MASRDFESLPEWERLLAAERHLQQLLPDAVLVGGTAAALHLKHRISRDGDHVLTDLRDRFDGMETGIRQLRRTKPLETEIVSGLRVPTIAEMARIKTWLLATRYTTRDYLDCVVLFERLGEEGLASALTNLDEIYRQDSGASPLAEAGERLAAAAPMDAAEVDLASYGGLLPPWNRWSHLAARGRHWAEVIARLVIATQGGGR